MGKIDSTSSYDTYKTSKHTKKYDADLKNRKGNSRDQRI